MKPGRPRVVIAGAGFGGLTCARALRHAPVEVLLVDRNNYHLFTPLLYQVAGALLDPGEIARPVRQLIRPLKNADFLQAVVTGVDFESRKLLTDHGPVDYDYLVLATGARLVPEQIPGLAAGSFGFYSFEDAERLREELRRFPGGRVKVGVAGIPYKCPPAPVEFVFMLDGLLRRRGLRERSEITLLSPLNRAFTIESASKLIQPIMERRGIGLETFFNVEAVDPSAGIVSSIEGDKAEYDLLVLVPPHRGQELIDRSGLGDPGGWLPTDRHTLQVESQERIFAIGDATNLPISKSGSTAHFEAPVVASRIASLIRGTAPRSNYGGRVMCFLETGGGKATVLRFDYEHPPAPPRPASTWHWAKWMFNRLYWETVPKGRIPERTGRSRREMP
jgi:sulfide:quinone oxidoreductase